MFHVKYFSLEKLETHSFLAQAEIVALNKAIREYETHTCLRFRQYSEDHKPPNYVRVQLDTGLIFCYVSPKCLI